jgi:hypothetical protein
VAPGSWGRGEDFEGQDSTVWRRLSQAAQNNVNLMVGSSLQHMSKVGEA